MAAESISEFKGKVFTEISSKTDPRSIPPAIVGGRFNALADIVDGIVTTGGIKGDKGDKGDTGNTGLTGATGNPGTQGLKGDKGDKGDTGAAGAQGVKGDTGLQGADGLTGDDGIGVPIGGTNGQVLAKNSNADYDTVWTNAPDLDTFVPYTGAIYDVNLGRNDLLFTSDATHDTTVQIMSDYDIGGVRRYINALASGFIVSMDGAGQNYYANLSASYLALTNFNNSKNFSLAWSAGYIKFLCDTDIRFSATSVQVDSLPVNANDVLRLTDYNTLGDARYLKRVGGTLTGDVQQTAGWVNANSLITKGYVDNAITGLSWKQEVRAASLFNVTLSGNQTVDNVNLVSGDRVLVKNQTAAIDNGIYVVQAGAWVRAIDADTSTEIGTATVLVRNGTNNKNTQWTCTNSVDPVIGVDNITFGQISGAGTYTNGTGILLAANVFSLDLTYSDARYFQTSGILPIVNGGTNTNAAGITAINNISGRSYTGFSGTGNLLGSITPTISQGLTVGNPFTGNANTITLLPNTASGSQSQPGIIFQNNSAVNQFNFAYSGGTGGYMFLANSSNAVVWQVSQAGATTASGGYTQSGAGVNTFTGTSNFATITTTGIGINNPAAVALNNVARLSFNHASSTGIAYFDAVVSSTTGPLFDFVWTQYTGVSTAQNMRLTAGGMLLVATGTDNGSSAKLQVVNGNTGNVFAAFSFGNGTNYLMGGGYLTTGSYLQTGGTATNLLINPGGGNVIIGANTVTTGAEKLQVTGSVSISTTLKVGSVNGNFNPSADNSFTLGSSTGNRWSNFYTVNGNIGILTSPNATITVLNAGTFNATGSFTYATPAMTGTVLQLLGNNTTNSQVEGITAPKLKGWAGYYTSGDIITSAQYKLSALNTAPASATDTGVLGEIRVTAGYIYVCTATNVWVRASMITF